MMASVRIGGTFGRSNRQSGHAAPIRLRQDDSALIVTSQRRHPRCRQQEHPAIGKCRLFAVCVVMGAHTSYCRSPTVFHGCAPVAQAQGHSGTADPEPRSARRRPLSFPLCRYLLGVKQFLRARHRMSRATESMLVVAYARTRPSRAHRGARRAADGRPGALSSTRSSGQAARHGRRHFRRFMAEHAASLRRRADDAP